MEVRLTSTQAGMLLFFAGHRRTPCSGARTTQSLIARGLLVRDDRTQRYDLTELGRAVVARLTSGPMVPEPESDAGDPA